MSGWMVEHFTVYGAALTVIGVHCQQTGQWLCSHHPVHLVPLRRSDLVNPSGLNPLHVEVVTLCPPF